MPRPAVELTQEFRRVQCLPRRRLDLGEAAVHADGWTARLRRRGGAMALSSWQGLAITEFLEQGGFFGGLPVGFGKTLLLYCFALAGGYKRPLIITRAGLIEAFWTALGGLQKHWRPLAHPLTIVSREILGRRGHEGDLELLRPDFVGIDECDELANATTAGCTLRIDRYRTAHPEAAFACVTGTPSRDEFLGYWHLICWALPRGNAPVPYVREEAQRWGLAIDGRLRATPIHPGPLGATRSAAQDWLRHRLCETAGILLRDEDPCKAPLTIRQRTALEDPILDRAFDHLLKYDETPGGEIVTDPLVRWGIDGRLGAGLFHFYDPPPPDEWRSARRALGRFVRDQVQRSQRRAKPLDTEGAVIAAFRDHPVVLEWLRVKPLFKPITRVRWLTDSVIRSCLDWLSESAEPGVVWVGSPEFGERLAQRAGLLYYGRRGMSAAGVYLGACPRDRSLVASWVANSRGFDNLKHFDRHLTVMQPWSNVRATAASTTGG